jgi:hypothetical protein
MKPTFLKNLVISMFVLFLMGSFSLSFAEGDGLVEVAKGKIPAQFLEKSIKKLPSGVVIWDVEEVISVLKDKKTNILWVDTRPASFLKIGTIKNAIQLYCDMKGNPIPDTEKDAALTGELLKENMKKIDPDTSKVKVVFFCQGPKCHRSYNAAIRTVSEFGLDASQVIWFRDGYPTLEKHILDDAKLKKRMARYLRGDVLS